ncbi:acyl carrier protein [Burkholderia sp. Tr-862]|jgi:acyl carrier protein|uniref:acyl carrier protein n=1 Tax=Burkholderia TaxID=32008 RepID=UPI000CFFF1B2|nr:MULTISPECIES: acyl carrier protein [Burkholderia]NIF39871.1 acyl carrier protein [Burkholderia sp. Tr-862]PRG11384.1 acyl carrier protein [Burkholderia ambifaria]
MTEKTVAIPDLIASTCRDTLGFADLRGDEDFFDRGASSLTIVELQIQVENRLQVRVPTSKLMAAPTIDGWAGIYEAAAAELA